MTNLSIYKASAGSGKTYTLVKEYIKKGLQSDLKISHKSLLAITFTNKAANEMKTRIIDILFYFSQGLKNIENSPYKILYNDLKIELEYTDLELLDRSKKLLSNIIHYYGLFSVSTIDKFIHKIIRSFSYELDLPSNFEVEMDSEKMIQEAVLSLIDEIGVDKTLTNNLITYSFHKVKEDKNWDIQDDLVKVSKQLFKDEKGSLVQNLPDSKTIDFKQKELILQIKNFEQKINNLKQDLKKIISGIPEDVFLYRDLPRYLKKIEKPPYFNIHPSNRLCDSIKNNNWYKKSESISNKKKVDNISELLCEKLNFLLKLISSDYPNYLFFRKCYSSFFLISVLSKIDQKIKQIKQDNSIVHISEFNQIIYKFLKDSPAPFIYEKIGNRYHHYFIDEFQDTSNIQWSNLIPLVEEALSTGGTCLIVGDGKQSIYRWRGGKVSQFLKLCSRDQTQPLSQFSKSIEALNINYRSGHKIVQFNNKFFSFLSQKLLSPYNRLYETLNQKSYSQEPGYIEISMLDTQGVETIQATIDSICRSIELIQKDNYNFSDIVILTRSNKDIEKIATHLTARGIPIISSESLLLKNAPTIKFMIDNFSVMLDDSDFLAKARVLEYLFENDIIKLDQPHKIISQYAKKDNIEFQEFLYKEGVNWDVTTFSKLNLYELSEALIRLFKINTNTNIYVTFFLDFVFDFSIKHNNSIYDFLNYWDQKKDSASIIIPSGINAVEIMTIHKSKGLQFPIVIFPFANWKEDLGKDTKWFNVSKFFKNNINQHTETYTLLPLKKELENWPEPFPMHYAQQKSDVSLDNINLLYVAMTRPKDRLYIIGNLDQRKGGIYNYFMDFMSLKENVAKFQNNIFIDGERTIKKLKPNTQSLFKPSVFISEDWRNRIKIKETKGFNKSLQKNYSIVWGNLIHQIMAGVNTEKDIETMLIRLNIMKRYGVNIFNKIKKEITHIITNKKVQHLFQTQLKTFSEVSILNLDGDIYRPDRVVIHADREASLVDYKTGRQKLSDQAQMKKYESVLLELGYKKINKYLIYFSNSEIKKL